MYPLTCLPQRAQSQGHFPLPRLSHRSPLVLPWVLLVLLPPPALPHPPLRLKRAPLQRPPLPLSPLLPLCPLQLLPQHLPLTTRCSSTTAQTHLQQLLLPLPPSTRTPAQLPHRAPLAESAPATSSHALQWGRAARVLQALPLLRLLQDPWERLERPPMSCSSSTLVHRAPRLHPLPTVAASLATPLAPPSLRPPPPRPPPLRPPPLPRPPRPATSLARCAPHC